MTETSAFLLLSHLRVQNANAISGPQTWGFPAPTAFLGFVHALERRLASRVALAFGGVGIVCHRFEPQVFRPAGRFHQVFRLTRNPLNHKGESAALIEEARAHLEVSLLLQVRTELDPDEQRTAIAAIGDEVAAMRLAGGSLLPNSTPPLWLPWYDTPEANTTAFRRLRRRLLPGFALVARDDLLAARLAELRAQPGGRPADALEALLDLCRLNYAPVGPDPEHPDTTHWERRARPAGWLVPLPVGYAGLSPLYPPGEVRNARDRQSPVRFVESLYSLGAWVSPHRLSVPEQLLWHSDTNLDAGLYRCINRYPDTLHTAVADHSEGIAR